MRRREFIAALGGAAAMPLGGAFGAPARSDKSTASVCYASAIRRRRSSILCARAYTTSD